MKVVVSFFILIFLTQNLFADLKPKLLLLKSYKYKKDVAGWVMSEKLDGVRAYWDGVHLISRSGRVFHPPRFFTKDFPSFKLDGELWSKRGEFSKISSIVNHKKINDGWANLTYNIFEVPDADGNLTQRLSKVKDTKYIKVIKQINIKSPKDIKEFLKKVELLGGEGVVVRDARIPYHTGRSKNDLKVKSYKDAECEIVGYKDGIGKYKDMVGSFLCKLDNDNIIKIGSGLSDKLRKNKLKLGTIITFKYYGLTSKGNPRFPIFLRVRERLNNEL